LSSPLNPIAPPGSLPEEGSPPPPTSVISENPRWSEWEVLQIAMLTVASIVTFLFLITFAAQRLFYPNSTIVEVGGYPW